MAPRPLRSTAQLLCLLCVGLRTADAARNCYRECLPSADICMADPNKCDDTNCNTVNRPVTRGPPPGYTEDLRCVASMRRERANCSSLSGFAHTGLNGRCRTALEIYQWGEIPPKPDDRTLPEKIEGQEKGFQNRMCCNIDACSITDFQACRAQVRTLAFPVSCSISS